MSNPTPWYMTIATFESGDASVDSIMLAPGEKRDVTLNKTAKAGRCNMTSSMIMEPNGVIVHF
jgi:P pilus assembly chaperone PapD